MAVRTKLCYVCFIFGFCFAFFFVFMLSSEPRPSFNRSSMCMRPRQSHAVTSSLSYLFLILRKYRFYFTEYIFVPFIVVFSLYGERVRRTFFPSG